MHPVGEWRDPAPRKQGQTAHKTATDTFSHTDTQIHTHTFTKIHTNRDKGTDRQTNKESLKTGKGREYEKMALK